MLSHEKTSKKNESFDIFNIVIKISNLNPLNSINSMHKNRSWFFNRWSTVNLNYQQVCNVEITFFFAKIPFYGAETMISRIETIV